MGKRNELKDLDIMRKLALGGALATKSASVMGHAGSPTALTGDISGFVGIGIAGAASKVSMDMITGKYKKKKGKEYY